MIKNIKTLLLFGILLTSTYGTLGFSPRMPTNQRHLMGAFIGCFFVAINIYFARKATIISTHDYAIYRNNFWGQLFSSFNLWCPTSCASGNYIVKARYHNSILVSGNDIYINGQKIDLSGSKNNPQTITDAGIVEEKIIDIPPINDMIIANIGKLKVRLCGETDQETLTISADQNIMPHLKYKIRNNQLVLGVKNNVNVSTKTPVIFSAIVKHLIVIKVNNDAQAEIHSPISGKALTLFANNDAIISSKQTHNLNSLYLLISNNSKIEINAKAQNVSIDANNNAHITATLTTNELDVKGDNDSQINISGTTTKQTITLYNDSKYHALDLSSTTATITAKNDSKAKIAATNITYDLNNNSLLTYKGTPLQLTGTNKNDSKVSKA